MRNIKLIIEYDGSRFNGFQKQKRENTETVQDLLEGFIKNILGEDIKTTASGRTDTGVHALCQTVSFLCESTFSTDDMKRAFNALFHGKAAVKSCTEVPLDFHARFSAKKRTYRYYILNRNLYPSIGGSYVFNVREKLNVELMKKGASYFIGEKDFKGFSSKMQNDKLTVRKVFSSEIFTGREFLKKYGGFEIPVCSSWTDDLIIYEVSANGFLRSMVRMMTGILIRIGRSKCLPEEILRIIELRDSSLVEHPAPPHALFLSEVEY